jgi:AmmeMemoRadiSam system protein B/AmmeMemoRadiSam system protein A
MTGHVTPYAGSWYPGEAAELRALVDRLFADSEQRAGRFLAPRPTAFVVPHAGLRYSGTVSAAAWRHIRAAQPERIVLIGFSHAGGPRGCVVPDVDRYSTPVGDVEVEHLPFPRVPEDAVCDHSVEIQLPLLLAAAPGAKLMPLYVSRLDGAERREAARTLAALANQGAVLVASSDFTHFGHNFGYMPFQPDEWAGDRLRDLDEETMFAMASLLPDLFLESLRRSGSTVCGSGPIALLLETVGRLKDEEIFQETLDYQTSGEITGDFSHSVSYGALGYFPYTSYHLNGEDQQLLLGSARNTLKRYLATGERTPVPPERITPGLERRATAFVTLHSGGRLRGCVGRRASGEPLAKVVPEMTLAAALDDSRFEPVLPGDERLDLEISVLTPSKPLLDRDAFRVGEHGATLEAGDQRGLLLPQVATERNWNANQFFAALAHKAGVRPDADARISVFRAQIIGEAA